jgi:hypothetical protein
MNFDLAKSIEILKRTPLVIETQLKGLSQDWITNNEGDKTWSPFDIVGHLIHGEKTDWIPRLQIILGKDSNRNFEPFDRFAQFSESEGKSLNELLVDFKKLRAKNITILESIPFNETTFGMEGIHTTFGKVTLKQLLATWVVHDLNHISQICRIMAKQYINEVGKWQEFLPILNNGVKIK